MDQAMLDKLHEVELEMMDEVDRICRKHDIPYFLDSGTALGAVRHGGFIPWDDDVDIGMFRPDYDRFLEIAKDELDPAYVIVTHENEPNYLYWHAKIRKKNTLYPQKIYENCKYRGIQLDLFPFDRACGDTAEIVRRIRRIRFYRKLCEAASSTKKSKSAVRQMFRQCLKIVPDRFYRGALEKAMGKYNSSQTGHLTCYTYWMMKEQYIYFKTEDIFPVKDVAFENRTYRIMNDPDAYLKVMYGDYMQLPPEEKRRVHLDGEILFDHKE